MDLRLLDLDLQARRGRAVFADAAGESDAALEGEAYGRVEAACAPLFGAVESRIGGACHLQLTRLRVDFAGREIAAWTDETPGDAPATRLTGTAFATLQRWSGDVARQAAAEARPRGPRPAGEISAPAFWSSLYQAGRDGWELGRAAPPLQRFFAGQDLAGERVLVVGCGRGHEARALARAGAEVVALDFAAEALDEARRLAAAEGVTVDWRQQDLFTLAASPPGAPFDLAVEHTCYCAIDPARRGAYVENVAAVLRPGGRLVGLFWHHGGEGGPPFSVTPDEVRAQFAPRFEVEEAALAPDSVALRANQEWLFVLKKR